MGCTGNTPVDIKEDIQDYDERYNFYNFKSKRKVKNPMPPSKYNEEKENNYSSNNNNINNDNNENKSKNDDEDEDNKQKNKKNKNNNNEENENSTENNNKKYGDLYRNNKKNPNEQNKKKNPNVDIYDLLNSDNSDNNSSHGDNSKNKKQNKQKKQRKDNINSEDNNNNDNDNEYENYSNTYTANNKDLFSEKGKKIPKYETNNEKLKEIEEEEEEKNKNLKKSKINGITIVENLEDYFPEDITKEEIQNLVFEAFGDSVVDDMSLYIPGQTVTYEQAVELSIYIYNIIKNKKNNNQKCLEDLNVKIDLVPLNKKLIKDKMFKGKEPSDKQIENIYESYGGDSSEIKVLTIEFQ